MRRLPCCRLWRRSRRQPRRRWLPRQLQPLLIAARAAQGLGAAVMMALTMAFVGETVPKAKLGGAMGLLATMSAMGTALGPSLGGVLIAGPGWPASSPAGRTP